MIPDYNYLRSIDKLFKSFRAYPFYAGVANRRRKKYKRPQR